MKTTYRTTVICNNIPYTSCDECGNEVKPTDDCCGSCNSIFIDDPISEILKKYKRNDHFNYDGSVK